MELTIPQLNAMATFERDLKELQEAQKAKNVPEPPPIAAQPPAPMVVLGPWAPSGQTHVPVAPMMASPSVHDQPQPEADNTPVAPFPDMGVEMASIPIHQGLKAREEKLSPKPASQPARSVAKPSPLVNVPPKQGPKAAQNQPSASYASAPGPSQDRHIDLSGAENKFTNMVFAPSNNDAQTQMQGQDSSLEMAVFDDPVEISSTAFAQQARPDMPQSSSFPQDDNSKKSGNISNDNFFNLDDPGSSSVFEDLTGTDDNFNNFDDMVSFDNANTSSDNDFNTGRFGNGS